VRQIDKDIEATAERHYWKLGAGRPVMADAPEAQEFFGLVW
jgi:hypothetical protein